MHNQPSTATPDDIDITVLWGAVRRNGLRLLIATLLAGAVTYLVVSTMTPQYTSIAQLIIERDQNSFIQPQGEAAFAQNNPIDNETFLSQVNVLLSRDLAIIVAEKLKLATKPEFNSSLRPQGLIGSTLAMVFGRRDDAVIPERERVTDALNDALTVYSVRDSRVITIDASSEDSQLAADIANTLGETYIALQKTRKVDQNRGASKWLDGRTKELRIEVQAAEARLERFRTQAGLISGGGNVSLNAQQLSEINSQLSIAKAQRSEAQARARLIRELANSGDVDASPDVLRSALIQRLAEQRVRIQRQISELSATLLPKHPRMRQLAAELSGINRQVRGEVRKIVRGLENEVKIASARVSSLAASLERTRSQAENSSDALGQLKVLEREAKSKRELYEAYVTKHGDVNQRRDVLSVPVLSRFLQKARASSIPVFPKKGPLTLLAMAAMFLTGLALIVTKGLLTGARGASTAVNHSAPLAADVRHQQRPRPDPIAPRIADVQSHPAPVPAPERTPAAQIAAPVKSELVQQANSITKLANMIAEHGPKGIGIRTMITGAGEGNDFVANTIDLAKALEDIGRDVIVVEWGRHENTISGELELPRTPGIRELSAGKATFEDVVSRLPGTTIQIIASGNPEIDVKNAPSLDSLTVVLEALDETYDDIIIAGPHGEAREFLQLLSGNVDVGVTIERRVETMPPDGLFLGFQVPGLLIVALNIAGKPKRLASVKKRLSRLRTGVVRPHGVPLQ